MGWYMVKSGLEDRFQGPADVPRVSQYRLAAHLSLAFVLYAGLLGGALRVLRPFPPGTLSKLRALGGVTALAHSVKALAFVTAVSGKLMLSVSETNNIIPLRSHSSWTRPSWYCTALVVIVLNHKPLYYVKF